MARKQFSIINFIERSSKEGLPCNILIFGEETSKKFVIREIIRMLVKRADGVFILETKDSDLSPVDIKDLLTFHELFGDRKTLYFVDPDKAKNLKKYSCAEIYSLNSGGALVLDKSQKNLTKEDMEVIEDLKICAVDCDKVDFESGEYRSYAGLLVESILGISPRSDVIDHIANKKVDLDTLWQMSMSILLCEDSLIRENLTPPLFDAHRKKISSNDIDHFLFSVLIKNMPASLEYLESLFSSGDRTSYILYYLSDFIEKLYSVKVRKNISFLEISQLLKVNRNKAKAMMAGSRRWSKFDLEDSLRNIYKIDKMYMASKRSSVSGKTQLDQFIIRLMSD